MPIEQPESSPETLRDLMRQLTAGQAEQFPEAETWDQMIARIHVSGRIHRINEETYDYFLEVLPPRWMRGGSFAFAEGQNPLQLFWARGRDEVLSPDCFTRRLNDEEIDEFCRLAHIPTDYGAYYGNEF